MHISRLLQTFTPPEKKDDKYWEKRGKNNIAARRLNFIIEQILQMKIEMQIHVQIQILGEEREK